MNLGSRIRSGVSWLLLGSVSYQVLSVAVGIVLARLLTPEVFGMLVAIQIFTGLAGFISGGGMGQALVRAKHVDPRDIDVVFTLQIVIGIAIYLGFYIVAPAIAAWYETPIYKDLLRVSAVTFLLRPFVNLPSNILSRDMRFKAQTVARLLTLLASSAVSVAMAFAGYGVWSLVLGGLSGSAAGIVTMVSLARWRPRLCLEWSRGRDLARYGFLTTTGDFIVYVRGQATNFILSRTLGSHQLGLFNKGNSLALVPQNLTASVSGPTFRVMGKEYDNVDLSRYLYLRSVTLVSIYTWPAFVALAWLALPLLRFVYGAKWVGAAPPLTWFALVGPFITLEILAGTVLAARNWVAREIPVQIVQLIVVTLGTIAGLPHGLLGVAIGASVANIYGAMHMSWLASRCLSMSAWQIISALRVPMLLNIPLLVLSLTTDWLLPHQGGMADLPYLVLMLGSAGALYVLLFMLAPIESLETERRRWIDLIKKGLIWRVNA
jgi:O-antigen/teichoic acid export membrane protein